MNAPAVGEIWAHAESGNQYAVVARVHGKTLSVAQVWRAFSRLWLEDVGVVGLKDIAKMLNRRWVEGVLYMEHGKSDAHTYWRDLDDFCDDFTLVRRPG